MILLGIFTDLVSRQSSAIGRFRPPVSTLSFELTSTYVKDYFVRKLLSGETHIRLSALSGPIKWAVNHKKSKVLLKELTQKQAAKRAQGRRHGVDCGGHVQPTFARGCF